MYGLAHANIFEPNSHISDAEETAATVEAQPQHGGKNRRSVTIPVRAVWRSVKRVSKKLSRMSSKSSITRSNEENADDLESVAEVYLPDEEREVNEVKY